MIPIIHISQPSRSGTTISWINSQSKSYANGYSNFSYVELESMEYTRSLCEDQYRYRHESVSLTINRNKVPIKTNIPKGTQRVPPKRGGLPKYIVLKVRLEELHVDKILHMDRIMWIRIGVCCLLFRVYVNIEL